MLSRRKVDYVQGGGSHNIGVDGDGMPIVAVMIIEIKDGYEGDGDNELMVMEVMVVVVKDAMAVAMGAMTVMKIITYGGDKSDSDGEGSDSYVSGHNNGNYNTYLWW